MSLVRVTGGVLPVYAHAGWQVETVWADLGTGLREWIEVRHDDERRLCADAAQRDELLHELGLDLRDFVQVDAVEDGCE